jgi:hypothetical protein
MHLQAGTAAADQVDGGVQRVAAEGLAQVAKGLALQFQHAFAQRGDRHRPGGGRGGKVHDLKMKQRFNKDNVSGQARIPWFTPGV